jgi:hypothetical protein
MFWALSSNCNISPFLVRTFLTSRIVFVLSSIFRVSNSSLVFKFRNLMISFSYVGISPSSPLVLSMACLLLNTNSCCSNMICTSGQISIMDFEISIQMFSSASGSVLPKIVFFCSCCSCYLSFSNVCLIVL